MSPKSQEPKDLLKAVHAQTGSESYTFLNSCDFEFLGSVNKVRLHNGLTVILAVDETMPVFAYHSWFAVGSRHESPGRTGIAHLFEHLMFKATANCPDGEFDRIMETRGAQTNAATWVDWTYYHETLPATGDNLDVTIKLEADRMANLVLNADQLESERDVVKNERRYVVDNNPDGKMFEVLYNDALPDHPYGWPTIGWMEDIEAITLDDCMDFYRAYYAPNNAIIVVSGNVCPVETLTLIARHYGHLKAQTLPTVAAPQDVVPIPEARHKTLNLPVAAPRLLMGWLSPSQMDPALAAIDVALELLFGGESSRLHCELVIERELAATVSGWASHFRFPGLVEVGVTMRPGKEAAEAEEAICTALNALAANPPTDAEMTKARNQLEAGLYRSMTTASNRAAKLGHFEVTTDDYRNLKKAIDSVLTVTPEAVMRAVARYLDPDTRTVLLAMPAEATQ
jgi:zinc protease